MNITAMITDVFLSEVCYLISTSMADHASRGSNIRLIGMPYQLPSYPTPPSHPQGGIHSIVCVCVVEEGVAIEREVSFQVKKKKEVLARILEFQTGPLYSSQELIHYLYLVMYFFFNYSFIFLLTQSIKSRML